MADSEPSPFDVPDDARQLVALALGYLAADRPGWSMALRRLAGQVGVENLFDAFFELRADRTFAEALAERTSGGWRDRAHAHMQGLRAGLLVDDSPEAQARVRGALEALAYVGALSPSYAAEVAQSVGVDGD